MNSATASQVYLNGRFVKREDALVSALDRGSLFGDGVYEVVPVYSRHALRLDEHLSRLEASLAAIELANPHTREAWRALIHDVIARQPFDDQSVYLHITRGNAGEREFHHPVGVAPTVLINPTPLVTPSAEVKAAGVRALSHVDFRWLRCDIKSLNLLPAVMMRQMAKRAGCAEVVYFRDGKLTEGAASNIFAVKDGVLLAPPKSTLMLSGITYDIVLELARRHGVLISVREIAEREVRAADELWMTSSTREVLSLVELDGQPIGDGRVGPLARQMDAWYQDYKNEFMRTGNG